MYAYVDIYVDGRQRHIPIHRIVYMSWIGEVPQGMQINHKDDNQLNNSVSNLYAGSQKDNIKDCIDNSHRVGAMNYLTVLDKESKEIMTFCPARNFIEYSGHPCQNGGVSRMFSRNWFKKRFLLLEYNLVNDLDELKRVTTIADECKQVG